MGCDRDYGIAGYPACSGNGYCVESQCICFEGWASKSGFEFDLGFDCDINLTIIKILMGIDLIVSSFVTLFFIFRFFQKRNYFGKEVNPTKSICIISFIFSNLGIMLVSYRRFDNPENNVVGYDVASCIGYSLCLNCLVIACLALYYLIVDFLRRYSKMLDPIWRDRINAHNEITSNVAPFSIIIPLMMTIISFISIKYPQYGDYWNMLSIIAAFFGYVFYATFLLSNFYVFLRELKSYLN